LLVELFISFLISHFVYYVKRKSSGTDFLFAISRATQFRGYLSTSSVFEKKKKRKKNYALHGSFTQAKCSESLSDDAQWKTWWNLRL